jgi:hypothetical protein
MKPRIDERTRQLWHQAYLAGERFIEARATWERLYEAAAADDGDQEAYTAAVHVMDQAALILAELVRQAGMPAQGRRLILGADGLMELTLWDAVAQAMWREEPIDVRPARPERLWDGRERRSANPARLPLYNRYCVPEEVENVS